MSKVIKVTEFDVALAQLNILTSKKLKKEINPIMKKVANAKKNIDKTLPPEETQYILED